MASTDTRDNGGNTPHDRSTPSVVESRTRAPRAGGGRAWAARHTLGLCVAATIGSVVVVHGRNLGQSFAFDDFLWLESRPSGLGGILDALVSQQRSSVYRPLLDLWMDGNAWVFGVHPLPNHLFALGFAIAAALSVLWLCRALGLRRSSATVAAIFAGTNGCLVIATLWASAAPSLAMAACAALAIAVIQRPGAGRQIGAAALLAVAILWRDTAVVVPAVATVLMLARPLDPLRLSVALRATTSLWVVSAGYAALRLSRGLFATSPQDPYHSGIGTHVAKNLWTMIRYTGRFGMYRSEGAPETLALAGLFVVFWGVVVVGSLLCLRRRDFLPVAGLAAYVIGLAPMLGLTNHPMQTYYVEVAIIGLAVTVGALVEWWSPRRVVLIGGTVAFVFLMSVAAKVVDDRHGINAFQARTDVLTRNAHRYPIVDNTLVVERACPIDAEATRDGAMFRVVLDDPDLRVRFDVRPTKGRAPWC